MHNFEKTIGYTFKNKLLLKDALTHPSASLSSSFQELEFLGDRVLGVSIATLIFQTKKSVKNMASDFNYIVSSDSLVELAKEWRVYLYLSHKIQALSSKVLVDVVEAVLGAIYIDSDFSTVFELITKCYFSVLKSDIIISSKMQLQEFSQKHYQCLPVYKTVSEYEKNNIKKFTVQVNVLKFSAKGVGTSKQKASEIAAYNLLLLLHSLAV